MKRCIVLVIAAASLCFAQSRAVDKHGAMMAEGRPFMTDGGLYNSYDLDNSPLGLFDIDSSRFSAEAGYGYLGLRGFNRHGLSDWKVRAGEPGRAFFEVFYGPDFLSYEGAGNSASLPLHRFGLTLATQIAGGFFGAALSTEGYIGTQTWENGDSSRYLWGIPNKLRIDVRSQVHPLVRAGVFGNVTIRYDTLHAANGQHEDFWAQVNLPELGGSVDFGGEDLPIRSNLSVLYASSGFAYRTYGAAGGVPIADAGKRAPAIVNDSLQLFWMAQGRFPINDGYTVKPGLLFGYSANAGEQREPSADNYPINLGAARDGSKYTLNALRVGAGTGFEAFQYADAHLEYTASLWSLSCGSGFPSPADTSRTLHHTAFGVSTPLHEYIDMPLKITPRVAYFISGESGNIRSRWSNMEPLNVNNVNSGKSMSYLYMPQDFLTGFTRVSGFTFGADGAALEDRLSASLWVTFLTSKNELDSQGGAEFGLSAGFRL